MALVVWLLELKEELLRELLPILEDRGYRVGLLRRGGSSRPPLARAEGHLNGFFSYSTKEPPRELRYLIYRFFSDCDVVLTDLEVKGALRVKAEGSAEAVASSIEEALLRGNLDEEVELFVNGRPIPMKGYVKETLKGVLLGFIKPLKGVEWPPKEVEVRIALKGKRGS